LFTSGAIYKHKIQTFLPLLFVFLLIYDGGIRKWFLPEYEKVIYFAKDFVLLVILGGILLCKREKKIEYLGPAGVIVPLVLYASFVLIEAFNSKLPNFWVGLLGIKAHILYASLLIVIPALLSDLKSIFAVIERWLPWLVIPVCLVGFMQVFSNQESFLNAAVRGGLMYVPLSGGSVVRANATFSYVTGFSYFQIAASIATMFWLICKDKLSLPMWLTIVIVFLSLPLSGSRAVLVTVLMASAIICSASILSRSINKTIIRRSLISAVLVIAGALLVPLDLWGGIIERFVTSSTVPGDSARYFTNFTNAFNFFDKAGLLGFGAGSTHQASAYLVTSQPPYSWLPPGIESLGFEQESGRLVLELGVVGWALSLVFRLAGFILSVNLILKGKNLDIRSIGTLCAPAMALGVHSGSGFTLPPIGAVFYWSCFALLLIGWKEQCEVKYASH
jgi:hypothetical protein